MLPGPRRLLALSTVALALTSSLAACKKSVGDLQTIDVVADAPGDPGRPADVHIEMQSGELHVTSGGLHVVGGAAKTNVSDLAPAVAIAGYRVSVTQGKPGTEAAKWGPSLIADYRLTLGTTPMALTVTAKEGPTDLDLGGLALQSVTVRAGVGPVRVGFNAANLLAAEKLDIQSDVGPVTLMDAGRFGASTIRVHTGAGPIGISLGSKVDREVSLDLETGAGAVRLALPAGVTARAEVKSEAGPLKLNGWTKEGDAYIFGTPVPNPRVNIRIKTGAGPIQLETVP